MTESQDTLSYKATGLEKHSNRLNRESPLSVVMLKMHLISETGDELELLIDVVETILEEHHPPSNHSDYDLELHIGSRKEVNAALVKLQGIRHEQPVEDRES